MEPLSNKDKLSELQTVIRKMSLDDCCAAVLPELGLRWTDVKQAVRNSRLKMTSGSVARILRRHVAKTLTAEEIRKLVAQLKIKAVASSDSRVWHVVRLREPLRAPAPAARWARELAHRVEAAATRAVKGGRVEVHSCKLGDFVFLSVSRARAAASASALYVCACANQPVCAVTSLGTVLLKAVVEGLGYKHHVDAALSGRDLISLLRISDRRFNVDVGQLTEPPPYRPMPTISDRGIDYTYQDYNEQYVNQLIGPDPPLMNTLEIKSDQPFFDLDRLNKNMSVSLNIKSDDLAKTLKHWVAIKTIAPTSAFFEIFHKIQTNKITYNREYLDDEGTVLDPADVSHAN